MDEIKNRFVERMGVLAQGDGLPRISGRLLGLMVLENGPFSFSRLAEDLDVSRASVSTNTRMLEDLGVIERIAKSGERQDYFQLARTPYAKLLQGLLSRSRTAEDLIKTTQKALPQGGHQHRLNELAAFYHEMIKAYELVINEIEGENNSE